MRTIMWLSGGLSVGLGMVTLAYKGFEQPAGDVATSFSQLGWDALPLLTVPTEGFVGCPQTRYSYHRHHRSWRVV